MANNSILTTSEKFQFLSGGGEMGSLMRSFDWSQTAAGIPASWSQSLRTTLNILLHSKFPMFLWWGPELTCFYNDAYRPSLGENGKHPAILGQPAKEAWPEIWHIIKPLIDQVLQGGEATWSEDQLIPIYRNGKMEDVYWTFSYSPVTDESESVTGVLVICSETTEKVKIVDQLKISKNELEFAIQAAELGTFDYDPATNKFSANGRLKKWFGLPDDYQIELHHAINAIAEKDRSRVVGAIEKIIQFESGGNYDIEYTIIHPVTEKETIVHAKGIAWFNESKVAYRFNGTLEDVTEQTIARRKIEESEQRFQAAIAAVNGILWTNNAHGEMEGEQPGWAALTGQIYEQYQGFGWSAAVHPEDAEPTIDAWNEAVKERKTFLFEHRVKNKDGVYKNFSIRAIPLLDGNVIREWVGIHTDITEQKNAEAAIRESEERFRNMAESTDILIALGDETSNATYFNKAWEEFTGRPMQELLQFGWADLIHPDNREPFVNIFLEAFKKKKPVNDEFRILTADKAYKWLLVKGLPRYRPDGSFAGYISSCIDITARKKAEDALKDSSEKQSAALKKLEASEKEFRLLADSLPEMVWTTDEKGNQIFASKRWREYTGLDPYDQNTFAKMVHPDDLRNIIEVWTGSLHTGHIYKTQVRIKNKEGDYQWFYVHGEPIKDGQGKIEKWVGAFTNFNEQKKVEQELIAALLQIEESEIRFRNVANNAPVLIWMSGADKRYSFFNTEWLSFTGRTMEQELGNGWTKGIHPEDVKKYIDAFEKAFEKKENFYAEFRLKRKDGEYRWLSDNAVPRFTADGIFEGYIGACMDIHERVIYQKKLKEDEERLNIIIEASELATWELNLQDNKFNYSPRLLEIFGNINTLDDHSEILKQVHPEDLQIRAIAFNEAYATGVLHYVSRVIWEDKSIHWIENKGKIFYDEANEPLKLIGTSRDITEEKSYQQKLEEREQKFRLLADSMPQFIWTGDAEGNLNYFSKSVYDYSGLTAEQIDKDGWLQIVHPDEKEENVKAWINSVTTGKDFIFEHRFGRHDGEYRWQLSRAIPQKDASGNIRMWVGTSTDIQEIKELDQQKDFFISMASHELKTPITSIKGYVQMLQSMYEKTEDGFLKNSLQIIDKQISTLTNLISDLLDLSKIKSGNLVLNRENFQMSELVEEVITEIKHINPDYNISFSNQTQALVNADRRRIGQVLINFLTNAVKYSPNSKRIKIEAVTENNNIRVSVEDSGIGINKTDQEKIFERFYRVEGKNEKTFPGFGIGLFIASEIIRRHNGKINVKSEPAKGSVFYFSIPFTN